MTQRTCCYIATYDASGALIGGGTPCTKPAEWQIWDGPAPDDFTESCTEHVGAMLSDAPEHRVYPIEVSARGES